MKTLAFRTVMEQAFALAGLPYSATTQEDRDVCAAAISQRVFEAWRNWPFPEFLTIEERAFASNYDAARAYTGGEIVWYAAEEAYFECILASTGNAPTNATYWTETTRPPELLIEREQYGATKIDRLWSVWRDQPPHSDGNLSFQSVETADGWVVPKATGDTVWIVFSKVPPVFTATPWSAEGDYDRYDLVFNPGTEGNFPDRGETYVLELDQNGDDFWLKVDFPACLAGYATAGAASDLVRFRGNREAGAELEAKANTKLYDEWDRVKPMLSALIVTRDL